ncbi:UDP-N-acetylenolpyruvoylglucosamine reductase [Rickettsiales bacterium (ex Bugula neritina AB1)]|nr:UDP-N-acetylenolpyruvoylglucosamine reductase [Rickettsiales bacterium (ex Bugula neritina AB1)]
MLNLVSILDLKHFTWFKTGGKPLGYFRPNNINELCNFIAKKNKENIPILFLGNGSNVIIRDGGINAFVIRTSNCLKKISLIDENTIEAEAGVQDRFLADFALQNSLSGFEYLHTIPGTVGGAIKMNSGCYNQETKDIIFEVHCINERGEIIILNNKECGFSYRYSNIPNNWIIIKGIFKGIKKNKQDILKKMENFEKQRNATQPIGSRTAGSTFKNPLPLKAWELIKSSNAHEITCGDAVISSLHNNFMINKNNATSLDLETLGNKIIEKVFEKYKIKLEWEIHIFGEK